MPTTIDAHLFHLLYGRGEGALTAAMTVFSMIGGGWGMTALAPLLFLRKARRFAVFLIGALLVTAVIVFVLKGIVQRGRPVTIFDDVRAIALDSPTDFSFPSGHAAGSFCFAVFVSNALSALLPRRRGAHAAGVSALIFAAIVAVSRVVLGFHYPLDIAGGAILGGLVGGLACRRYLAAEP